MRPVRSRRSSRAALPRRPLLWLAVLVAIAAWVIAIVTFMHRGQSPVQPVQPALPAHRAQAAATFRNSVGVNVHLSYTSTAYGDFPAVVAALRRLGVRRIRDGACAGCGPMLSRLDVLRKLGIRATLIVGDPRNTTGTLDQNLALIRTRLGGMVEAIEGPNEYDRSGDPHWPATLQAYQHALWNAVQADPALRRLEVIGPSFGTNGGPSLAGDMSAWMDEGNLHPYPGGEPPGVNLDDQFAQATRVSGRRPLVATETGYHDALRTAGGHPPVDDATAAAYLPQLCLEYFRRGIRRTFLYELVDERPDPALSDIQQHFGLLRSDWSPKPAFTALQSLLAAVGDGAPPDGPGTLRYTVARPGPELRQLLFQRADGGFSLVLWRAQRIWDPATRRPLRAASDDVIVRLGQRIASATVSGAGAAAVTRSDPRTLTVAVGAAPVVVRLDPPG